MTSLLRKSGGQPLREAMARLGLTQADLAARTVQVDASGQGVSLATVVKVTGSGKTANGRCRLRTAWLVASALQMPIQDCFDLPAVSTDTVERYDTDGVSDPH